MRKVLFILIVVSCWVGMTGCSDDGNKGPDVSFRRPYYILPASESLNVEVRLSEPAQADITVPFTVAGTGEEGLIIRFLLMNLSCRPGWIRPS